MACRGFSSKPVDALFLVDRDDAEAARVGDGDFDGRERDRRAALLMGPQHARVVHLVDVIAGKDDQIPRAFPRDRIEILIDGVRRSLIPVLADALLRRQNLDEFAELLGDDAPAHADVAVERERLVLRGDEDAAQAGVDAVAEREVDDAVRSAEIDRRLGAVFRQRIQPLARAAREHDHQAVVEERRHDGSVPPQQHARRRARAVKGVLPGWIGRLASRETVTSMSFMAAAKPG